MTARSMAGALMAAVLFVAPARAQSWRTLTAQRSLSREDSLHVVVRYGFGTLMLRAAPPATLYQLELTYDADIFRPEKVYDAPSRTLRVGADSLTSEHLEFHWNKFQSRRQKTEGGTMTLLLARGIPLDLSVDIGIGEAKIDLGDLWVDRLRLDAAMGGGTLDFPTPNLHAMRELTIDASMGGVSVTHLGNARAQQVKATAALGGGELDLRGAWTGEMTLDVSATMGGFDIMVPDDAGVRIIVGTHLGGIDAKGFSHQNGEYLSPGYAAAKRKLTITGRATLGGLSITRVAP